ncbi:hypothetical protein [Vitiosangium sp. GDMCC 1.1324]|uniref:hypothetical protein n=1 Tax=Vitiosangium sp. (strain GDMCC 1.1324) TaxID=2138576 RepID=UPI000D3A9B1A|nr:hypothetical protein [Vitiosangium sp. GDMCC 1.1324]PTL77940.1 hypothetical protein DAT35_42140 [Vitiosangium sp. GDMCC 1.1324]
MPARRFFTAAVLLLSSQASWAIEPPWGKAQNLGERRLLEKTAVCTDGKGHYVSLSPTEDGHQLFYGDGRTFVQVPLSRLGAYFLEPRFFNKNANPNFQGMDMRVYSQVVVEKEKGLCEVRCGERTQPFTFVESDKAGELLRAASFNANPQKFVPYALLRDSKGVYYLVERGFLPDEENRFRVSIGLKGSLKPQQMVNLVTDSEGQIFSTKKGDLRLLVDQKKPSIWIEGKKRVELRVVPVSENLPLIYNELGPYTGARLGTPCDDQ